MTQSQIRCFLTVAQELSFSKAAELLYVSQPAVSRQIAQLEQEVEFPLFTRSKQEISLTEAGEAFRDFWENQLKAYQELIDHLHARSNILKGTVNIGCAEGWDLSSFFPQVTASLAESNPDIELNISGFNHDHIVHALEHNEVDVIITTENLLRSHQKLESVPLCKRRGILLFSSQHRLVGKQGLALEDFKNEPFYVTTPPAMREATIELISICADADFTPRIEYVPTLSAAYMKLSSGRGVLYCNDLMMSLNNPLFTHLPLHICRPIHLAWNRENESQLVKLFSSHIKQWFDQHPESGSY